MINFVEYLYANNVFYYRRTERYGERVSASVTVFSYTLGFCIIALNFLQLFTGSLAPFVRQAAPAFNKPYNNAAEYVLIVPVALLVHDALAADFARDD